MLTVLPWVRERSVFEKTYAYVKRMSFPNATVETTQSIRQCVLSDAPPNSPGTDEATRPGAVADPRRCVPVSTVH